MGAWPHSSPRDPRPSFRMTSTSAAPRHNAPYKAFLRPDPGSLEVLTVGWQLAKASRVMGHLRVTRDGLRHRPLRPGPPQRRPDRDMPSRPRWQLTNHPRPTSARSGERRLFESSAKPAFRTKTISPRIAGAYSSEADGTRTRNHRIDSPEL